MIVSVTRFLYPPVPLLKYSGTCILDLHQINIVCPLELYMRVLFTTAQFTLS